MRLLRPLRHRDFGLLWAGMSVSILGDGFYLVALAWLVYELADTPAALAIVGAAAALPSVVFVLPGGVLTDRFERRRILIVSDLLRGLAVGAIGGLALAGLLELWHVVALAALYGLGEALFGPSFTALVPDLVPKQELAEAMSVDQIVRPLGLNLLGPALGGLLITVAGAGTALLVDAGTFAVSIGALLLMRPHPLPPRPGAPRGLGAALAEIGEGFGYVRAHTWLWGTLVAASISLLAFMGPMRVLVPFVVKNRLGGTAADLGLVFAAGGVGAILASLVFSQRGLPRRAVVWMFLAWTLASYAIAGFGVVDALWQAAAVSLASSGLATVGQLIWATLVGTRVPRDLLGRVSSFDWLLSIGLVPASFMATGPVSELIGVSQTLIAAGLVGGTLFLAFLFLPGMRDPEQTAIAAAAAAK